MQNTTGITTGIQIQAITEAPAGRGTPSPTLERHGWRLPWSPSPARQSRDSDEEPRTTAFLCDLLLLSFFKRGCQKSGCKPCSTAPPLRPTRRSARAFFSWPPVGGRRSAACTCRRARGQCPSLGPRRSAGRLPCAPPPCQSCSAMRLQVRLMRTRH